MAQGAQEQIFVGIKRCNLVGLVENLMFFKSFEILFQIFRFLFISIGIKRYNSGRLVETSHIQFKKRD